MSHARPQLLRLPQMPVLMAWQNRQTGIHVVLNAPVEGRPDPELSQLHSIRLHHTTFLSGLKPVELAEQLGARHSCRWSESRLRLHSMANRGARHAPHEPSKNISPITPRRWPAELPSTLERGKEKRQIRLRSQVQVANALRDRPAGRIWSACPVSLRHGLRKNTKSVLRRSKLLPDSLELRMQCGGDAHF